jgi:hypothetical protein
MATSTIPALKTNLVAQLQARAALSQVQVSYGPPLPNPGREFIWCSTTAGSQVWETAAKGKLEEYDQRVVILVVREGVNMQAADARCFALCAELENTLRTDPTVNGAVNDAYLGGFTLSEGAGDSERESTLIVQIHCRAWI